MNKRLLGILLTFTLALLTASGFWMYFTPFSNKTASIHTFFGLVFVVFIAFHLLNNRTPLGHYLSGKRSARFKKFLAPFLLFVFAGLAFGLYFELPFLNGLYTFGNEYRNQQLGKKEQDFKLQLLDMTPSTGSHQLSIELKKGDAFQYPLFAIWLEDTTGNYIQTLYVSRVIASSNYDYGKKDNGEWQTATLRRPEALPFWSHQRGIKAKDGLFIPLENALDLDGVSGATPTNSFLVNTTLTLSEDTPYKVFLEVNQSFDWNQYYSKDKYPEDAVYSGSGKVGQPSLIYAATINTPTSGPVHKIMELKGHGHPSGKTGALYTDLSNITSAKNIARRIVLTAEHLQ